MSAGAAAHGILAAMRAIRNDAPARSVLETLTTALDDVALVYQVNTQLQRDVSGLTRQSVADAREITRLTRANDALNEQLHALNCEQHALETPV